ncbi:Ac75-like protein [Plodia interpunctella granulovirus]|uniref:Ac75-like protein n=1 Tax=Plodia interpunctella granulovirus TaxID=262175 RepID=A0A1L5JH53_9BBAC|nr:Ac75-like protein [Plodia interpunctella granulovirus]APO13979.1 Ac75-like protein [Plodia interpunctella granulovirus]
MNFDFLKDLVSLNPIKATYVSNSFRSNFNFIIDDHIKEKRLMQNEQTLLEKLKLILGMFLNDELDKNVMYKLFGGKLDLSKNQFEYLYEKIKQDVYIRRLIHKICLQLDNDNNIDTLKHNLLRTIDDDDGFTNISSFMIRECNTAAKI